MYKIFKIIFFSFFGFLFLFTEVISAEEKIKIGLLVPITGDDKELGQQIVKSTRIALNDINEERLEIHLKDTNSNPNKTLKSALELKQLGVKIVIGPVFYKSLTYLEEIEEITFLSLTNKTLNLPRNVISGGINATSQLTTIKKFIKLNEIKETIILTPKADYENEIKKAIKNSKIKISKHHIYSAEPTKLTEQIEKITDYKIRKQNLEDEKKRVENSDLVDKEKLLEKLNKIYTIGDVNFDSVIISDFNENLKSIITTLLYTDVSPEKKYIITFNQWFNESLLSDETIQPIYYPSINQKNLENFKNRFKEEFNKSPSYLSLLSYDFMGLVYYLSLKNDLKNTSTLFKNKNTFKGKIGIFDVENNKINHRLNFYKIENKVLKEIF